jgi:ABC-type multidrug transport system fused ATPase/permease subunit
MWSSGLLGSTGWAGNLTILTLLGYGAFSCLASSCIASSENDISGGTLVSRGEISVGDLTSLLLYSAYVGGSLSMLR